MKSPLVKAEAGLKDESAKKMAEKIVDKREATKAAGMAKPARKEEPVAPLPMPAKPKETERIVPEKVMDPPQKKKEIPMDPAEDQLCLVRRRGTVTLARYRKGEFYASHAGFYSDLVDKPDAWVAVPEF